MEPSCAREAVTLRKTWSNTVYEFYPGMTVMVGCENHTTLCRLVLLRPVPVCALAERGGPF